NLILRAHSNTADPGSPWSRVRWSDLLGRLHGGFFDACFLRLSPLRFDGFVRCFDAFDEGADGSVTLTNGIRIVTVYFPGSTNESIFTYLPMSLTSDGPRQSQCAHLVEHLRI